MPVGATLAGGTSGITAITVVVLLAEALPGSELAVPPLLKTGRYLWHRPNSTA
jgi:hypothetical protein